MKSLLKYIILVLIIFLIKACANIQSPTGGPKDLNPPKLIKSFPKSGTLNYHGENIDLFFDENVVLKDINEQLIINPIPKGNYEAVARKNRVKIIFNKPFNPNTTYTLTFRDAVRDVTENNIVKNLSVAFSTGEEIDTMKINGSVLDLRTNIKKPNVIISLYNYGDTNTILNSKPLYFTRTEASGTFNLNNIKKGEYKIYALAEKNNDLLYNQREEQTGFDTINLDKDIKGLQINISRMDSKAPSLLNMKPDGKETSILFNEGLAYFSIKEDVKSTDTLIYQFSSDKKSVIIYDTKNIYDSIPVSFTATDSAGNTLKKTINIIFMKDEKPEKSDKKEKKKKEAFINKIDPADKAFVPGIMKIKIIFNKPIVREDLEEITIKADSGIAEKLNPANYTWQENRTIFKIEKKINFKDSLILNIPKGSFYNVTGDTNTNQKINFSLKKEELFAIVKGSVKTAAKNYYLELLDKDYKVVQSLKNIKDFNFEYINPGAYYMRSYVDENGNNKWDSGNLEKNIQAEPMFFYKEKLDLRANWEITDLIFEF